METRHIKRDSSSARFIEQTVRRFVQARLAPYREHLTGWRRWFLTANGITTFRVIYTVPVVLNIYTGMQGYPVAFLVALAYIVLASITDTFDGVVARYDNSSSVVGAFYDSSVDKLLTIPVFGLMLWEWHRFAFLGVYHVMVEWLIWGGIALDVANLILNVINLMRVAAAKQSPTAVYSTVFGQIKFWAMVITILALLFCRALPDYQFGIPNVIGLVFAPVGTTMAFLSMVFKISWKTAPATS